LSGLFCTTARSCRRCFITRCARSCASSRSRILETYGGGPASQGLRQGREDPVSAAASRTNELIHDCLEAAGHGEDESGALFRPIRNNPTGRLDKALDPDMVYKLVRGYSAELGFEIGAHALRATAAINALDHQADIAKVQEWLGHVNIATTRIYDHRKTRPEDSPTFKVAY
jgi:integrase